MPAKLSPDLLKIIVWPVVAVLIIILVLATGGLGSAETVELGPLKISFAEDVRAKVGEASPEVAAAVARMDPQDMETLIAHGEGTGRPICTVGNLRTDLSAPVPKDVRMEFDAYARLTALRLIELREPAPDYDPAWCKPGGVRLAWPTDEGTKVRRYLIDLLTKSLVIKKS